LTQDILSALWNEYARAGYENIYVFRVAKEHRDRLAQLFMPTTNGAVYLDHGCGAGTMFEPVLSRIRPSALYAVDWSTKMLSKAEVEATRLSIYPTQFRFFISDLSEPLAWQSHHFDGVVSNLVICYLSCGWEKPLREIARILKPGGYLYLGLLLSSFMRMTAKQAAVEFFYDCLHVVRGLKYVRILSRIRTQLRKTEVLFPSRAELVSVVRALGFEEIVVIPTLWEGGLVLRARLAY